ncbi:hypothetical protein C0995_000950 [Termitomyces sp. Mi166|nr:hypothetical protein C0995_000950 [Termitomyces sp. Mi166\
MTGFVSGLVNTGSVKWKATLLIYIKLTVLQNRKQDLIKIWKTIFKTTDDEALLLDLPEQCAFTVTTSIVPQLKAEALKWMEKVKDKEEKAVGVLKGETKRKATELLRLIRKVVAHTPPPEDDDDDDEDDEKETS